MGEIRFDGRVAIVTGAGGGLGRAHAMTLASRGAKVVVNDLGVGLDGSGSESSMADKVVEEIKSAGGEAVANYDGVNTMEGGQNIAKTAIDAFGKIDIVINNAGILRDRSFMKMTEEEWDAVIAVHMKGAFCVTKAAWPYMRENAFGRIVSAASAAGLFGSFGQNNYASAKTAMIGFTNSLNQEGAKYNIKANIIAPFAASRMTESVLPPEILEKLNPEYVSTIVAYLCSEECDLAGGIFSAGGGFFARCAIMEGPGFYKSPDQGLTIEDVRDNFDAINSLEGAKYMASASDEAMLLIGTISK